VHVLRQYGHTVLAVDVKLVHKKNALNIHLPKVTIYVSFYQ